MKIWIKYFGILLATTLGALAIVAIGNFTIDFENVYGRYDAAVSDYMRQYVAELRASRYGIQAVNYERPLKLELIRQTQADCYLTGSSHEMRISIGTFPAAAALGCREMINLAVSFGGYEDFLVFAAALQGKPSLRKLIVGINPAMLHRSANVKWQEHAEYLPPARKALQLAEISTETGFASRALNIINGEYLLANLRDLADGFNPIPNLHAIEGPRATYDSNVFYADGRFEYAGPDNAVAVGTPMKDPGDDIFDPPVDAEIAKEFEQVFLRFISRGVDVVILLLPYNPVALRASTPSARAGFSEIEAALRAIASRMNLHVIGSFDPSRFGLQSSDFRDHVHMTKAGLLRITATQ